MTHFDVTPIRSSPTKTNKTLTPEQEKKMKRACADFEALLTYHMLKTMRRTIPRGGILTQSNHIETWNMFLDHHIAELLSQQGRGLGIQKLLYDYITKRMHPGMDEKK